MRFAAIGLDHRHIYELAAGLIEAGVVSRSEKQTEKMRPVSCTVR